MKINFAISLCLVLISCMAMAEYGWCQPELVYIEEASEIKIEGIDNLKPYYTEAGEKKFFTEGGEVFLRKNDCDILSFGYAPVNYIAKNDNVNPSEAIVTILNDSNQYAWNGFRINSFLKIWNEDHIKKAMCFLCWYEPNKDLLRIGDFVIIPYSDGKLFRNTMSVEIESEEQNGFPVIFLWDNNGLIKPKSSGVNNEGFFRSVILDQTDKFEGAIKEKSLYKGKDVIGNKAIHYAAAFGRTEILKKLIAEGADINAESKNGMTPLLLATATGHRNVVNILLQNDVDIKCEDNDKRTALHYASYCGHEAIVGELLKYSKAVNKKDEFNQSPVHYAINEHNDSIVGLLANSKANIHSDKENLQMVLVSHVSEEEYNIVSFLLDQNAKADVEINGTTPLVVAAGNSSLEMVELLVDSGASVDKPNKNQMTPLLSACLSGRPEVVKYLLEKNAEVNIQSENGLSTIQAAVLRNDPEMIKLLASYGVDIDEKDKSGKTPFWNAAILGYRESMKTLLDVGASCSLNPTDAIELMELAFRYDMPEAVNLALDQCLDANFTFYDKYPSTWVAQYYEAEEIMDLLVADGAEKDAGGDLGIIPMPVLSEKPKILEYSDIYYPLDLKRKYGSRKFMVQILINEQGKVFFPKMVDSEMPEIERIVMESIINWRFTVPKNDSGQACSTIANLPIILKCEDIEKRTWELSEIDQMPKIIKSDPPMYPFLLKREGIQGRVVLNVIIDETGKVEKIGIDSMTHAGFAESAIAAAKGYVFSPGYYQGRPVKVGVQLPISFILD